MRKSKNILHRLSSKFGISSSELSDFLYIDRRTLYNYKNLSDDSVPEKVKTKIIEFFCANYDKELDSLEKIYDYIDVLPEEQRLKMYREFVYAAQLKHKISIDSKNKSRFEELMESMNVSEAYMENLMELLKTKLQDGNDYGLLDHIDKYKK